MEAKTYDSAVGELNEELRLQREINADLLADIESLTANRDSAVKERNKFLLQRDELLALVNTVMETNINLGAGWSLRAAAAIAKATGAA